MTDEGRTATATLLVAEALSRDVGRGIARMDPVEMARLGLQTGDVVELVGKRATAAKLMPAYRGDRGKGAVQIDGLMRQNAQVGLGEPVQVRRADSCEASAVALASTAPSRPGAVAKDVRFLQQSLEGLPLAQGDRVRVTLLGGRSQEFLVQETTPKGFVVTGPRTVVTAKGDGVPAQEKGGITYEDIGGLQKEVQRIREMIELPLKRPELFERLGIDAPKGVLLHGPPGCGKTLIARAVAQETDAAFFQVSGPEVIHKFYGESEAHLRTIFERAAERAPAIIFIDEIDAIATKREEVRADQQVERRVVAQLLALMDGLKARGQVIVIGATNIPHVLDPALRRPGRFDREIGIGVPDRNGRLDILRIHTRGMPLSRDVDLKSLAAQTHGFVGADLEALCREAAMATLRRLAPHLQAPASGASDSRLSDLEVTQQDFSEALKEVGPSALREAFTEVPDVTWDDVGGLETVKKTLVEIVQWPLQYPELFLGTKTSPPKGVLLLGPPGTGKTLLAKAVASQSGVNFISIKGPELLSRWLGESERGIREVFKKARQASPCILFFDELDALTPIRGSSDSHVTERVLSQLLTEMDGIEPLHGVTVLAATNRPDAVDPALLRSGRFDVQVTLPPPDRDARRQVLAVHTRGKPLAGDVDLDRLAAESDGLVGSDLEAVCRRAAMLAIEDAVNKMPDGPGPAKANVLQIAGRHFQQALHELRQR